MINSKSIGNKIAEGRKSKKLSQADLATQVSISPQAVGKWERGESMPDITMLNKIAKILGVDLNYFTGGVSNNESGTSKLIKTGIEKNEPRKKLEWNRDMSYASWTDADFSGLSNLKEKFSSSSLKNCKFLNSELSELLFKSNEVLSCDFSGSDMRNSKFHTSEITKSTFTTCSLIDAEFKSSEIRNCDFNNTNFEGAEFISSEFVKNKIEATQWRLTSFKSSYLVDLIFDGTIEDCSFESCAFKRVKFQNATLLNTFFKNNSKLNKIQFINCKVDKITHAFLKNGKANLTGLTLIE